MVVFWSIILVVTLVGVPLMLLSSLLKDFKKDAEKIRNWWSSK